MQISEFAPGGVLNVGGQLSGLVSLKDQFGFTVCKRGDQSILLGNIGARQYVVNFGLACTVVWLANADLAAAGFTVS